MPYIMQEDRPALDNTQLKALDFSGVGDLTYALFKCGLVYAAQYPKSFATYGDVIMGLECAKLEFYRRILAPYEETKIRLNGDVI